MSNILEPDISPLGVLKCTTHHYACDCREARFTAIEQENKLLRQRNAELQQKLNALTGPKLKTVKEIIIKYLEDHGYDGLYHDFNECSCRIHDLFEGTDQQDLCSTCHPGYEIKLDPTENAGLDWDIVSEKEWNEHREKAER